MIFETLAFIFISLASLIHIYIFVMESLLWGTPRINKVFDVTNEQAQANKLFAFNQGFYNLFLAIAAAAGLVISRSEYRVIGLTLMCYACLSMIGAALVLIYSQPKLVRASLIQGLAPFLGLLLLFL